VNQKQIFWRYSVLILKKDAFLKRAWVYTDFMSPCLGFTRRYFNVNIRQIRDTTVTSWFQVLSFNKDRLWKYCLLKLMQLNQYGRVSMTQFEPIQLSRVIWYCALKCETNSHRCGSQTLPLHISFHCKIRIYKPLYKPYFYCSRMSFLRVPFTTILSTVLKRFSNNKNAKTCYYTFIPGNPLNFAHSIGVW
jgi:hypothetical protein